MSILSDEAKDILEYAYEQDGLTYPDGETIKARDVLVSWYSDEYKSYYGIRPRWEGAFPFSNAYLAIDIARVRIAHGDELKWQEDEAKRIANEEAQEKADHAKATAEALTTTEWTIGDLVQI